MAGLASLLPKGKFHHAWACGTCDTPVMHRPAAVVRQSDTGTVAGGSGSDPTMQKHSIIPAGKRPVKHERPSTMSEPIRCAWRATQSVHELRSCRPTMVSVAMPGAQCRQVSAINAIVDQGRWRAPARRPAANSWSITKPPQRFLVDLPGWRQVPPRCAITAGADRALLQTRRHARVGWDDVRHRRNSTSRCWPTERTRPCHALKGDKLPRGQQSKALLETRRTLGDSATVQLFSASSHLGVDEARTRLSQWLELATGAAPAAE